MRARLGFLRVVTFTLPGVEAFEGSKVITGPLGHDAQSLLLTVTLQPPVRAGQWAQLWKRQP